MTRRQILALTPSAFLANLGFAQTPGTAAVYGGFPSQDLARVRAVIGAAHVDIEAVKKLVGESPALAKSATDWGFGDWESALGAASHTGRREIALFLVDNGARPDIFYFAMMGHLDAVKALITADPRLASLPGPHGIPLLAHARSGGEQAKAVVAYLESIPGTDTRAKALAITDEQKEIYLGRYSFGPGDDDVLEFIKNSQGLFRIRRGAVGFGQNLNFLGDHEFAPTGAPAVRVRFKVEGGRAVSVSIHDFIEVVSAKRV